jgi:putative phage-type endonuclease
MSRDRRTYIGGPDAAMIVGRSPFGSAFDVWQRKMGLAPEMQDPPVVVRCGTALEGLVCELYAERTGYRLQEVETVFDSVDSWRGGSVDRLILNDAGIAVGVLEAKTAQSWFRHDYGAEGTDEIPEHYLIQTAWYMALTGLPWADLAVLFGTNTLAVFHVERNERLEAALIERCRSFWDNHVLSQVPPELDGSEGADAYLQSLFPRNTLGMIPGDEAAEEHMKKLADYTATVATAERKKTFHEQQLKKLIGEHDGIQCATGRATWKAAKNGQRRFRFTDYRD